MEANYVWNSNKTYYIGYIYVGTWKRIFYHLRMIDSDYIMIQRTLNKNDKYADLSNDRDADLLYRDGYDHI